MNECRSLYLHIPLCLSRCRYCDFASHARLSPALRREYLSALCREIASLPSGELETVYFGGGTPSLLTERELSEILDAVARRFRIKPHAEVTLECNPATATLEKLKSFRALGVTRLSIGVQSLSDAELSALGRAHTANDARKTYGEARAAGFASVSMDLMYGLPGQTLSSFEKTLDEVLSLAPDHLSAYGLILEEGTPLYAARGQTVFPSEDEEYAMYEQIVRQTAALRYSHYEISNYAKEGHACRHNLVYWHREPYYAVGLSASSFDGRTRRTHTRDLGAYLADPLGSYEEITELSDADAAFEEIMLGLRLGEGISPSGFALRHGYDMTERYRRVLLPWRQRGLLREEDGRLYLSAEGLYLSSALLSEILSEEA
jgi:oxygen-independent coproporphyrinogen-3 oxidase